jgi:hypothetical protein
MSMFSFSRFLLVLRNDLLAQGKRLLLWLAYTVLAVLVTKLMFFDHFESFWSLESTVRFSIHFPDLLMSERFAKAMAFLLYLWLLFLSYSCLRDHEV